MGQSGKIKLVMCFLNGAILLMASACSTSEDSYPAYIDGIEHCDIHVKRYFDWHNFSTSVGTSLDIDEIGQMELISGHTLIVTPQTAYYDAIEPEQNVREFKSIAATCKEGYGDNKPVGLVSVKYIDKNNVEKMRYATSFFGGTITVGHLNPKWDESDYVAIPEKYNSP